MKVNDILIEACKMIGKEDVSVYLQSGISDDVPNAEGEKDKLLTAYKLALEDACVNFEPLEKAIIVTDANTVPFSLFEDRPLEVLSVRDERGRDVEYSINVDGIALDKNYSTLIVMYRYTPIARTVDDEFEYGCLKKTTPIAIAMGVASEYLAISGAVSEARSWRSKYEKAMFACMRPKGKRVMPGRRWYI